MKKRWKFVVLDIEIQNKIINAASATPGGDERKLLYSQG